MLHTKHNMKTISITVRHNSKETNKGERDFQTSEKFPFRSRILQTEREDA